MRQRLATMLSITALVTAIAIALPAQPAAACTCAGGTVEEQYARADAVFTGRLLDRRDPDNTGLSSSADFAALRFEVDAVYKGEVVIDQAVVTEQDTASCGVAFRGEGPFLVFANETHWAGRVVPDGMLHATSCDGTRPLGAAPVPASLGTARRPSAPTDGGDPATTAPSLSADGVEDENENDAVFIIGSLVAVVVIISGAIVFLTRRRAGPAAV